MVEARVVVGRDGGAGKDGCSMSREEDVVVVLLGENGKTGLSTDGIEV